MSDERKQINLSFSGDNRFASSMMQGRFLYFLEINSPLACQPAAAALALLKEKSRELAALPQIFAFVVTDRLLSEDCHDPYLAAEAISAGSGKPVIISISGKGSNLSRVKGILADAKAQGLRNFLAVSGDCQSQEQLAANPVHEHLDSLEILQAAGLFGPGLCLGATVNPFKYTPEDQCLQYTKMVRKLRAGASYLVTQAGWDMKKAQELQWFLQKREFAVMVAARVCLLSWEETQHLADGYRPGIYFSVPLGSALMQDAQGTQEEFQERQLRRVAKQIVGYQKLGYGGVQLSGLRDPVLLQKLFGLIAQEEASNPDYDHWLEHWNADYGKHNPAPGLGAHYLFNGLLQPGERDYEPEKHTLAGTRLQRPRRLDSWRARLGNLLHSGSRPPVWWRRILQTLCRMPEEKLQRLRPCFYLDNSSCPKGLRLGPCGGSRQDGQCEDGCQPCFFQLVMRLAAARNQFGILEGDHDDIAKQQ